MLFPLRKTPSEWARIGHLCFFQKKPLFSAIFFGLTFYTYSTSILLIPLILFYLFFTLKTNRKIFLVAIFFVTFPILLNIISGTAGNRFSQISIFNDSKKEAEIVFKRTGFSSPNLKTDKFFYNKFTWTNSVLIKNYLDALSPNTIFAKGDSYPRHSVPGFGFFLITTLPIFLLGLIKNKNKLHLFMLLIVPIASALTQSGATHGTRLYLLVLPISLIIAAGFKHTSDNFKKIFVILFLINFIGFFYEYYFFYPKEQFNYFNTGYKQLLSNLPKSKTIISNSNYNAVIPYLFYNQYNPKQLIESGFSTRPNSNGQLVLDKNIIFQNSSQSFDQKLQNLASGDYLLLWQKEDIPGDWNFSSSPPAGFKSVKTTFLPNGQILGQLIQKNEK